jgi:hypothetical protein
MLRPHLDYAVCRAFVEMSQTHILVVKGVPSGVLYEQMRVAVFREPLRSKLRPVFCEQNIEFERLMPPAESSRPSRA